MSSIQGYDTYWENDEGKETLITVNFIYYPPTKGGRNEYGVPMEPDEDASLEILNIRTLHGQDPRLVIPDWDRDYVVQVVTARIMEERYNDV